MINVLKSIQPVIENSRYVQINEQAVLDFSKNINENDFSNLIRIEKTVLKNGSDEEQIGLKVVFNVVNFCYWGEPKWTVKIGDKKYDGAQGLVLAIRNAIENGQNLLDARYLSHISKSEWNKVVAGNVEIPLCKERLILLRSFGEKLNQRFEGSYKELAKRSEYDCVKLVDLLTKEMPDIFNDVVVYHGKEADSIKEPSFCLTAYIVWENKDFFPKK